MVVSHSKSKCFPVSISSYGSNHQTFLLLFAATSNGVNAPFFVGCHSFTSSGYKAARELNSGWTFCPDKYGHPNPRTAIPWIEHSHSKLKCLPVLISSYGNNHQTFCGDPAITFFGFNVPFFVGCHCAAISGCVVSKSLNPSQTA
jgi:hypothetical protein